jgi:hypothetical protein
MPYSRPIDRQNPTCFLFLLDQSFSMEEPLGGAGERKCDELVTAINAWLQNMAIRASDEKGIKNYMDIGVIGYRTDPSNNTIIEPAIQGALSGRTLVSISDIANNPARNERRTSYIPDEETGENLENVVEVPVWVDPKAEGGTPMCTVLHHAYGVLDEWIQAHPNSFPPMVIHISDGESQDGDPVPYADAVKDLATNDGNVLLFNCHLSMTAADPFMFPNSAEVLPDDLARVLFNMSSVLPEGIASRAVASGTELQANARGMAFNANMVSLINFLDMGTRVALR